MWHNGCLSLAMSGPEDIEGAMPERDIEQRAFPRWVVAFPAHCYGSWGSSDCLIIEISEAGATVTSGHVARVGDEITIAWKFADGAPFQVTGVVRDFSQGRTGVEFSNVSLVDRLRILQFVRTKSTV
jgi:hypothetical protein